MRYRVVAVVIPKYDLGDAENEVSLSVETVTARGQRLRRVPDFPLHEQEEFLSQRGQLILETSRGSCDGVGGTEQKPAVGTSRTG